MPVSRKKVIVRKLSRDWLSGYLPPSAFVVQEQAEMLDLAGKLISVHMAEVKWICFVRDFQSGDVNQPERLLRKTFVTRPAQPGPVGSGAAEGQRLDRGPGAERSEPARGGWVVPHPTRHPVQYAADFSAPAGGRGAGCAGGDQDGGPARPEPSRCRRACSNSRIQSS